MEVQTTERMKLKQSYEVSTIELKKKRIQRYNCGKFDLAKLSGSQVLSRTGNHAGRGKRFNENTVNCAWVHIEWG